MRGFSIHGKSFFLKVKFRMEVWKNLYFAGLFLCNLTLITHKCSWEHELLYCYWVTFFAQKNLFIVFYYTASSVNGQDEPNRALWLATRVGKMEPSFFFCEFMDLNFVSVHKHANKKNLANIQPSWPHTWSITHTHCHVKSTVYHKASAEAYALYYAMIKHSGHLRTLEKCRKHSPAAHVFYISLVFSNAHRVLSQCNYTT